MLDSCSDHELGHTSLWALLEALQIRPFSHALSLAGPRLRQHCGAKSLEERTNLVALLNLETASVFIPCVACGMDQTGVFAKFGTSRQNLPEAVEPRRLTTFPLLPGTLS